MAAKKAPPGKLHTAAENRPAKGTDVWDDYVAARSSGDRVKQKRLLGKLCEIHEPLAMRYLQRFMTRWSQFGALPQDDLAQAARIGLMRAIQSFDPGSGRFGSWVHLWTRLELGLCAESYGVRTKRLPVDAATYRRIVDFEIRNNRIADPIDLPDIPEKKLRDAQFRAHFCDLEEEHHPTTMDEAEAALDERRQLLALSGIEVT